MTHDEHHKKFFGGWKLTVILICILVTLLAVALVPPIITTATIGDDEIVVGAILPLSGPQSSFGLEYQRGIELAVEELNNMMGTNIRVEYADSMSEEAIGLDAFLDMYENGIKAIIGPTTVAEAKAIAPFAEIFKITVLPFATSETLDLYKNYLFQFVSSDKYLSKTAASYEMILGEHSRVAVVWTQDDFPKTFIPSLMREAEKLNEEYALTNSSLEIFSIPYTTTEGVIKTLLERRPDVVLIDPESPAQLSEFSTALRSHPELNYLTVESTERGLGDEVIFNVNAVTTVVISPKGFVTDSLFLEKYHEKYHLDTKTENGCAPLGYDAMRTLADIIYTKGYSSEKIAEALKQYRIVGDTGAISFDKYCSRYPVFESSMACYSEWKYSDIINELVEGKGTQEFRKTFARLRAVMIQAFYAGDMESVNAINTIFASNDYSRDVSAILEKYPVPEETLVNIK